MRADFYELMKAKVCTGSPSGFSLSDEYYFRFIVCLALFYERSGAKRTRMLSGLVFCGVCFN